MSKLFRPNSNLCVKLERGTSLTLKQYEICAEFLKNGVKPTRRGLKNAGLTGTLNGGPDDDSDHDTRRKPYVRFKSIVKRLAYRASDGELIFKKNSKIVLSNNSVSGVIMKAHTSGIKHLNITRTTAKLSEKYAIGCRQFGICEETVRMVVKLCQDGSCVGKNIAQMKDLKPFGKLVKSKRGRPAVIKKSRGRPKTTVTAPTATPCIPPEVDTRCIPQAPVVNSVPMTVVRLYGTIGIQPSFGSKLQIFGTPIMPTPSFNLQSVPTNPVFQDNTQNLQCTSGSSWQPTMISSMPNMLRWLAPKLVLPATESRLSNPAPMPMKLVQVGSQPLIAGQQFYLMTSINTPITDQNSSDGQANKVSNGSIEYCTPINLMQHSETDDSDLYNYSNPAGECAIPGKHNQNNNCIVLSETDKDIIVKNIHADIWSNNETTGSYGLPIQFSRSDPALCGSYDNGGDIRDLTLYGQGSQQAADGCGSIVIDDGQGEDATPNVESKPPPIPHQHIWYNYDQLTRELNPYERINLCVQDMKKDVMMSLAGSYQATEKMKKKMLYLQEMVTAQKNITQHFSDLYSTR